MKAIIKNSTEEMSPLGPALESNMNTYPQRSCIKRPGRFLRILDPLNRISYLSTSGSTHSAKANVKDDGVSVCCDGEPQGHRSEETVVPDRNPDVLETSSDIPPPSDMDCRKALQHDIGQSQKIYKNAFTGLFPSNPVHSKRQNPRKKHHHASGPPRSVPKLHPISPQTSPANKSKSIPPPGSSQTVFKGWKVLERLSFQSNVQSGKARTHHSGAHTSPEFQRDAFPQIQNNSPASQQDSESSIPKEFKSRESARHRMSSDRTESPQRNNSAREFISGPDLQISASEDKAFHDTRVSSEIDNHNLAVEQHRKSEHEKAVESMEKQCRPSELENQKGDESLAQESVSDDNPKPQTSHCEPEKDVHVAPLVPIDSQMDAPKDAEVAADGISGSQEDAHEEVAAEVSSSPLDRTCSSRGSNKGDAPALLSVLQRSKSEPEKNATEQPYQIQRSTTEPEKKAKEEAQKNTNDEAEKKAKEKAEKKAKKEAAEKAKEETEKKAKEAAEQKAREEAEQKAKEETARKAKEGAEKKANHVKTDPTFSEIEASIDDARKKGGEKKEHKKRDLKRKLTRSITMTQEKKMDYEQSDCIAIFNAKERSTLKNYFEIHDADGNGNLGIAELLCVLDDMNRIPQQGSEDESMLMWLFDKFDEDLSGELDFEEFLNLMQHYYHTVYHRVFSQHDEDDSGNISIAELRSVIHELKTSGFQVLDEEVDHLFKDIDKNGDGELCFEEFSNLMESYRGLEFQNLEECAGFTENQLQHLRGMFADADEDMSGSLDLKEIVRLLEKSALGASLDDSKVLEEFVDVFARMDKDRSASLDFLEFIRLLRVWDKRGCRPEHLESIASHYDTKRPKRATSSIGSTATKDFSKSQTSEYEIQFDSQKLTEKRAKTETMADNAENRVIQKHHKLSLEEIEALRENFIFSDADGSGKISKGELPALLKNVGAAPTTSVQRASLDSALSKIMSTGIELDFIGVVGLIVEYHESCTRHVTQSFSGSIPVDQLLVIFYQVGQYIARSSLDQLLHDVGVSDSLAIEEDIFKKMLEKRRIQSLCEWRQTYGFKEDQIARFRDAFRTCASKEETIPLSKIAQIAETLGYETEDMGYETVATSSEEVNTPGQGGKRVLERFTASMNLKHVEAVLWSQFLLVLKQLDNMRLKVKIRTEHQLAEQMGLDRDAFLQLRQLFKSYDDNGIDQISKNSIKSLFSTMGVAKTQEQRKILRKTLEGIESERIDFAQFMSILRKLDGSGGF